MKIIIIGGGGHGQVVADILSRMQTIDQQIRIVGFLDDNRDLCGSLINEIDVLGPITDISKHHHDAVVVAVGNNRIRSNIVQRLKNHNVAYFSPIHPSAIIAKDVVIGKGTMICAGTIINTGSDVGEHVILNTGCTVDHHNRIEQFVHIAPGSHLGGEVCIGEGTLVGIGSTIFPRCSVGSWTIIAGGSVIRKNVPKNTLVYGNPAKVVKNQK